MQRRLVAIGAALALLAPSTPALSAAGLKFAARLTGDQQVPGIATPADGKVTVKFDEGFTQVEVKLNMTNIANVTAAHFHCNRPGQNGSVAFGLIAPGPCTLVANQINCTLTSADVQPSSCLSEVGREVNNIAALAFAMRDGLIYANVHTMANTSGEIRGQLLGK
jgi:hypothetical protein